MEKLELKHLADYLPYGLKLHCKDIDDEIGLQTGVLQSIDLGLTVKQTFDPRIVICVNDCEYYLDEDEIKPILKPLSEWTDLGKEWGYVTEGDFIRSVESGHIEYRLMQELLQENADVFGLIEKDLAIDINTLTKE